jgi:uncharacterized SAM-binding protein YcdF (DUF218 family)
MKKGLIRTGYVVLTIHILLIGGCVLFIPSSQKLYNIASKEKPFDAIIVPGVPFRSGTMDSIMKARVYWSFFLYKKGIAKNVIYSGSAVYTPYIESKIMAMYGIALGIDKEHVFSETEAQHSVENLYYSYKLARKKGFKNIALATDPVQSALLASFAKAHTPSVTLIPIIFDTIRAMNISKPNIEAYRAFVPNFVPLPNKQSFWERFKGTRGKNIVFDKN